MPKSTFHAVSIFSKENRTKVTLHGNQNTRVQKESRIMKKKLHAINKSAHGDAFEVNAL